MLKKASFLVVPIVAALVVPAAFSLSFNHGKVQTDCSIVSNFTQTVNSIPLSNLAESAGQSSPNPAAGHTDNRTASVTSAGAVKASFTVVSQPVIDQEESRVCLITDVACDPNCTTATTPAQEADGMTTGDPRTRNDRSDTAAVIGPKSGGLTTGWALIISVCSVGIAAVGVIAFRHGRARKRALAFKESSDSS